MNKMGDYKSKYPEFSEAVEELDSMTLYGYFGEKSKALLEARESYEDDVAYLVRVLTEWHEDKNQVKKIKTYQYMLIIFKLFINAVETNPKESLELISNFKLGNKDNTAMEFMTAYTEYVRVYNDTKLLSNEVNAEPGNIPKKMRFAKSISVAYSNGVEYIGKTLNLLICLEKIVKKERYNFYGVNKMLLNDKIKMFNSDNKYDVLLEMIDRDLRNGEAHVTINFVSKTNDYKLKKRENGKIVEKNIPFLTLVDKLILVGNYVQAFEFAGYLLFIGLKDKDNFIQLYNEFFG